MAANTAPIFEILPTIKGVTVVNADSTNLKTIQTGGSEGTRVDGIFVSSNDASAVNLAFYINDGANDLYIGNVVVPIGSGYTTVSRVEAMTTLSPLLGYLVLPYNYILKCNAVVAVTAAKTVTVVAQGGNY